MAYNNARLVSYVDSSWLSPPPPTTTNIINKKSQQQQIPHIASSYAYDSHSHYSANNDYILC
eukprot:UN06978